MSGLTVLRRGRAKRLVGRGRRRRLTGRRVRRLLRLSLLRLGLSLLVAVVVVAAERGVVRGLVGRVRVLVRAVAGVASVRRLRLVLLLRRLLTRRGLLTGRAEGRLLLHLLLVGVRSLVGRQDLLGRVRGVAATL